jgi:anti-sigma factor RsiW
MTGSHWIDRLSDYLDGGLDPEDRAAADRHLASCETCAGTLADLRAVVTSAALLPDIAPERDLWPDIRRRLSPRMSTAGTEPVVTPLVSRRRVVLTVPQLAAAGLVLMMASAAGAWIVASPPSDAGRVASSSGNAAAVLVAYDPAMADLEAEYHLRRHDLDPETVRVVERNLALIDLAIQEARDALAADPTSGFLSGHLAETVRRRMTLLRQVASL